jgi:AcrR family transcriptional regulator
MPHRSPSSKPGASDAGTVASSLVWTRPATKRRALLTREAIVAAATRLADAEGLAAVTVRRLAEELDARPMSIYSYARVESKEELFDLMVDQVCGEMLVTDLPDGWQQAVRAVATRGRAVLLEHPWWVELIGRNVLLGPNGTRYREQTLAAVHSLSADPEVKQAVVLAVETYMVGQVTFALDEQGSPEMEHRSVEQWQQAHQQYQQSLIATGEYPHLARLAPLPTSPEGRERFFNMGLDWLLTGIAASLEQH